MTDDDRDTLPPRPPDPRLVELEAANGAPLSPAGAAVHARQITDAWIAGHDGEIAACRALIAQVERGLQRQIDDLTDLVRKCRCHDGP